MLGMVAPTQFLKFTEPELLNTHYADGFTLQCNLIKYCNTAMSSDSYGFICI